MNRSGANREAVMVEAADWLARLDGAGEDPTLLSAFADWRAESPAHAIAVARLRYVWDVAGQAPQRHAPRRPEVSPKRRSRRRPGWLSGAAAAGMAAALAAGVAFLDAGTSYATAVGERRALDLGQGCRVELNTDTRVRVAWSGTQRRIVLERGEMFVASGSAAVSVRASSDGDLSLRNADLDVRLRGRAVQVAVLSGAVRVQRSAGSELLAAGELVNVSLGAPASRSQRVPQEVRRLLAWRQGRLDFDGQTLAEVAQEFNRYNTTKISVAPDAAGLRVGGAFEASAPLAFARGTAAALDLRVDRAPDGVRLAAAGRLSG